jgi:hypothetical protein
MRQHLVLLLCVTSSCLVGPAGLFIPAGYVYARETQQSCNAKRYVLCANGNCGSKYCGSIEPGGNVCYPTGRCYMCDGCTGDWVPVGRSEPNQGGMVPPESAGTLMPPTPSPRMPGTVTPGMTAPIMPRGIEGEQPAEPPPGTPERAEQPSGKKSE